MWVGANMALAGIIAAGEAVATEEASSAALHATMLAKGAQFPNGTPNRKVGLASEHQAQLTILRCLVGNPFRSVVLDPAWLTNDVRGLAATAYGDRAFDCLPILADALEEAGCTDEAILSHLRGPGPHARGCWVVDSVLDKK
jgi:hypothetical protein